MRRLGITSVRTTALSTWLHAFSILPHAEFDDIVVEVIFLGQLEQVLPRLLPEGQVYGVGVEPHLYYFLLLLELDVAREYRTE